MTTAKKVERTIVKNVRIGRPVKRVIPAGNTVGGAIDVEADQPEDGSVLVYDDTTEKWIATRILEKQFVNGGSY